jgi:hypothetical protein
MIAVYRQIPLLLFAEIHGREYSVNIQDHVLGTALAALILSLGYFSSESAMAGYMSASTRSMPRPTPQPQITMRLLLRAPPVSATVRACHLPQRPIRRYIITSPAGAGVSFASSPSVPTFTSVRARRSPRILLQSPHTAPHRNRILRPGTPHPSNPALPGPLSLPTRPGPCSLPTTNTPL